MGVEYLEKSSEFGFIQGLALSGRGCHGHDHDGRRGDGLAQVQLCAVHLILHHLDCANIVERMQDLVLW